MHYLRPIAVLAFLALLAPGCGGTNPGASSTAATATPQATTIPPELATYAQDVLPLLSTSTQLVDSLVKELATSRDMETIAQDCATAGSTLAADNTGFQSAVPPAPARKYFDSTVSAFDTALTATSDCSTAADTRTPRDLAAAAASLGRASRDLTTVRNGISQWSTSP